MILLLIGREGGREGVGREGGREGGVREGGRGEGGREGGRGEGGREGGREIKYMYNYDNFLTLHSFDSSAHSSN